MKAPGLLDLISTVFFFGIFVFPHRPQLNLHQPLMVNKIGSFVRGHCAQCVSGRGGFLNGLNFSRTWLPPHRAHRISLFRVIGFIVTPDDAGEAGYAAECKIPTPSPPRPRQSASRTGKRCAAAGKFNQPGRGAYDHSHSRSVAPASSPHSPPRRPWACRRRRRRPRHRDFPGHHPAASGRE